MCDDEMTTANTTRHGHAARQLVTHKANDRWCGGGGGSDGGSKRDPNKAEKTNDDQRGGVDDENTHRDDRRTDDPLKLCGGDGGCWLLVGLVACVAF